MTLYRMHFFPYLCQRKAINLIKKKGSTSNDASAEKVIQKVQESRFNFEEEGMDLV